MSCEEEAFWGPSFLDVPISEFDIFIKLYFIIWVCLILVTFSIRLKFV